MPTVSAPYWWVECDCTGCNMRTPDDDADVTAWASRDQAQISAREQGWANDRGSWFCPTCSDAAHRRRGEPCMVMLVLLDGSEAQCVLEAGHDGRCRTEEAGRGIG